jgi:antitoxin component of RelBE/YafQ-DinJ toxin-antitoxin module
MPTITIRVTSQQDTQITKAAQQAGLTVSEYIRQLIFASSAAARIDFYANINSQLAQIVRQAIFTTQLSCQILVNQTDPETVQNLMEEISKNIEEENNG